MTCKCGQTFCFKCGNEDHLPVSCDQVKEWLDKENDSGDTINWIKANTKNCPKCKVPIQKN